MCGACVRRAKFAAADGMPMPTKQTSSLLSARAAATVIISFGVYWVIVCRSCPRRDADDCALSPCGRGLLQWCDELEWVRGFDAPIDRDPSPTHCYCPRCGRPL